MRVTITASTGPRYRAISRMPAAYAPATLVSVPAGPAAYPFHAAGPV